jgi:hypothetical protein
VQFAIKAAPLFKLTWQDSKWKGGEMPPDAAEAFYKLRDEISSRPVMAYPNATGKYHLFVDAALGDENNSGGLGAVLMQDQVDGLRKPVAYASRRWDKHERNYPVFLAEMQAAVFGMEQFHHFSGHREVLALYGPPAAVQVVVGPREDLEQAAAEDDRAPPGH